MAVPDDGAAAAHGAARTFRPAVLALSRHMDDLEPRLVQHGYDARAVAELIGAKQGEVRLLLQGWLEASRAREMTEQMMAAGLPV